MAVDGRSPLFFLSYKIAFKSKKKAKNRNRFEGFDFNARPETDALRLLRKKEDKSENVKLKRKKEVKRGRRQWSFFPPETAGKSKKKY